MPLLRPSLLALSATALLAGCTNTALLEAERAQSDLIGMSKSDLFLCAGAPDRETSDESGQHYAAYDTERISYEPAPYPTYGFHPGFGFGAGSRWVGGYYAYPASVPKKRHCTATFTFKDNHITAVTYRTNEESDIATGQCYEIIKSCLSPAPAS